MSSYPSQEPKKESETSSSQVAAHEDVIMHLVSNDEDDKNTKESSLNAHKEPPLSSSDTTTTTTTTTIVPGTSVAVSVSSFNTTTRGVGTTTTSAAGKQSRSVMRNDHHHTDNNSDQEADDTLTTPGAVAVFLSGQERRNPYTGTSLGESNGNNNNNSTSTASTQQPSPPNDIVDVSSSLVVGGSGDTKRPQSSSQELLYQAELVDEEALRQQLKAQAQQEALEEMKLQSVEAQVIVGSSPEEEANEKRRRRCRCWIASLVVMLVVVGIVVGVVVGTRNTATTNPQQDPLVALQCTPPTQCTDTPISIRMRVSAEPCSASQNSQLSDPYYSCTDHGTIADHEEIIVRVTPTADDSIIYYLGFRTLGDQYMLFSPAALESTKTSALDPFVTVSLKTNTSLLLQETNFYVGCGTSTANVTLPNGTTTSDINVTSSSSMSLNETFGASQLVEFTTNEQGLVQCQ